ncbi:hypothetical protein ACFL03_10015 [Thermodesulfobacteriota bacterium]
MKKQRSGKVKLWRHIKNIGIKTLVGIYLFTSVTACALSNNYTFNNVRLDSKYYADSGQTMTDGTAQFTQSWWRKYWKHVLTVGWIGVLAYFWLIDDDPDGTVPPQCVGDCPEDNNDG